ncbi:hypothetical protein ACA910_002825 [Epithemia clementina (nom. ined.)]
MTAMARRSRAILPRKRVLRAPCTTRPHSWFYLILVLIIFSPWCSSDPTDENTENRFSSKLAAAAVSPNQGSDKLLLRQKKNEDVVPEAIIENPSSSTIPTATLGQILAKAGQRALGGGMSGALAGVVQVIALMWLRTITNYQYRYGTSFRQALQTLLKDGGIPRLYRGLLFALIQAPASKFAGVAANDGVMSLLGSFQETQLWGPGMTTIVSSVIFGFVRIFLMPIDTMKTVLQVDSHEGFENLMRSLRMGKFSVLYEGAWAVAVMGIVSYYPWFFTYNVMASTEWIKIAIPSALFRNAAIGLVASIASDTVANVFRVVKTMKQVSGTKSDSSYYDIIRKIVAADGLKGLFGRGLRTRLATNAIQSVMFTVVWRLLAEQWKSTSEKIGQDA